MTKEEFIENVFIQAQTRLYKIETNRNGQRQIDFGHKKLHELHLNVLYPRILENGVNIGKIIDSVAPGRPCVHRPMKSIIAALLEDSHPTKAY